MEEASELCVRRSGGEKAGAPTRGRDHRQPKYRSRGGNRNAYRNSDEPDAEHRSGFSRAGRQGEGCEWRWALVVGCVLHSPNLAPVAGITQEAIDLETHLRLYSWMHLQALHSIHDASLLGHVDTLRSSVLPVLPRLRVELCDALTSFTLPPSLSRTF